MAVDRCACRNVTFLSLKQIQQRENLSFSQLCDKAGCCKQCSMCEPYILEMMRTGETSFPVLNQKPGRRSGVRR